MSETFSRLEVITSVARQRRFTAEQKLLVINEKLQPGLSISYVARCHGLSPSLVSMETADERSDKQAVWADEDVVAACSPFRLLLLIHNTRSFSFSLVRFTTKNCLSPPFIADVICRLNYLIWRARSHIRLALRRWFSSILVSWLERNNAYGGARADRGRKSSGA
ncbi:transposase [Bradyrhizobium sp. UFLA05-109]